MKQPSATTVLSDSRGLDCYYLDRHYRTSYGIDSVFAYRMESHGRRTYLIPDHFRAGTIENNIMRVALTNPAAVVLCDGIWETLLNRQKYFEEAAAIGALQAELFGSSSADDIRHSGAVLTDLFLKGQLSVSPDAYAEKLGTIIGYFRRRRRSVAWLSLLLPDETYIDSVHHAGHYRPLPGWRTRLDAINKCAERALDVWGGTYVDLTALADTLKTSPLIDLWHFSADMHEAIAADLAARLNLAPTIEPSAIQEAVVSPGPIRDIPLVAVAETDRQAAAAEGYSTALTEPADIPPHSIIVVDGTAPDADNRAAALLATAPGTCVVLYASELSSPVPFDQKPDP